METRKKNGSAVLSALCTLTLSCFALTACSSGTSGQTYGSSNDGYSTEQQRSDEPQSVSERFVNLQNYNSRSSVIVDQETGIEYLYVTEGYKNGPCITVIYDTDGSPRIDPEWAAEHEQLQ